MLRITGRNFIAGIILHNGFGNRCAPILNHLYGMPEREIKSLCEARGWMWELI